MNLIHASTRALIGWMLAVLGSAALPGLEAQAQAQTLPKQTLSVSIGDPILSVHNANIIGVPIAGGLYERNGIQAKWTGTQGATLSMQAALAGSVDVAVGGTSAAFLVAASAPNARIIRLDAANVWNIAVPGDSRIKTIAELKGKRIGVQALAAAGYLFARGIVAAAGLDPDADVRWVPVGVGAQAASAIRSGEIDAYGANYGTTAQFARRVSQGMRFLPSAFDELPNGFAVVVSAEQIQKNRPALVAFLKSYNEGIVLSAANPTMGVTLHWNAFPNQRPSGTPLPEAIAETAEGLTRSWGAFATPSADGRLGIANREALAKLQDLYLRHGITKKAIDIDRVFDLSMADEAARRTDVDALKRTAAAWRP